MSDNVLLIDDDERLVSALRLRLSSVGYRVETARNGDEGLSMAAIFQPDVLVVDLRMPEIDGFEVCRLMRTVPELLDTPIIVLSASEDTSACQAALEAGGDAFLHKPYHYPQLLTMLRTMIDRRRDAQARQSQPLQNKRAFGR
jgi:DNA-binding response OmpR family regulator